MKTMSKADQDKIMKLHATSRRYAVASDRAKRWHESTGTAMYQPGALAALLKASKAASAEIKTVQAKYR